MLFTKINLFGKSMLSDIELVMKLFRFIEK